MPRHKPVFVALEGLRGVGKSMLAALLAERLGAHHVPSLPAEYTAVRTFLDHDSRNVDARAHLFASALFITADHVRDVLSAGQSVVIDSFVQRTVVTHRAYGTRVVLPTPSSFPQPITFYLTCAPAVRQTRLSERTKPTSWWDELAERVSPEIEAAYTKYVNYCIDTTFQEPDETTTAIVTALQQHCDAKQTADFLLRARAPTTAQATDQ